MDVLSVVHDGDPWTDLYASVIAEAGHRHREWSFSADGIPADTYDAVLVFGGSNHPDQDDRHLWLKEELRWLEGLIEAGTPSFGICLGSQLLARAAGSWVAPLDAPEIGWHEVELTDAGRADPVLSALPPRFTALESHYYAHGLPDGAVELARNTACLQAFRLGDACWGVQFHPEPTAARLDRWIEDRGEAFDPEQMRVETRRHIGEWNVLGRRICEAFLTAAA